MAGRPNKPLFELLREESNAGRREAISARVAAPTPELKPVPLTERAPAPREEVWARPSEPSLASTTVVSLPLYAIYVAGALALAICIAAWSIGWQMGVTKVRSEALTNALSAEPPVSPPGRDAGPAVQIDAGAAPKSAPAADPPARRAANQVAPPKAPPQERPSQSGTASKAIVTSTGSVDADPRTPGLNYLVISQRMEHAEAVELIQLLAKNNLEAVGVPLPKVDSSGKPTKNDGLLKVVALRGVTKEQYRDKSPERMALQEGLVRVGQQWKDPKRGRTDLSTWYWERLVP